MVRRCVHVSSSLCLDHDSTAATVRLMHTQVAELEARRNDSRTSRRKTDLQDLRLATDVPGQRAQLDLEPGLRALFALLHAPI